MFLLTSFLPSSFFSVFSFLRDNETHALHARCVSSTFVSLSFPSSSAVSVADFFFLNCILLSQPDIVWLLPLMTMLLLLFVNIFGHRSNIDDTTGRRRPKSRVTSNLPPFQRRCVASSARRAPRLLSIHFESGSFSLSLPSCVLTWRPTRSMTYLLWLPSKTTSFLPLGCTRDLALNTFTLDLYSCFLCFSTY